MPIPYAQQLEGVKEPLKSIVLRIIEESGGKIGITGHGGFRSREQQQRMYQDYLNGGNLAAKPGHSMHERGMAIDFSGDLDLLAKLAPKYGLVNSVDGEPWHYTLGEGARYEDEGDDAFNYGMSASAENPEDVLVSRMTAIMRILGGASPVGTQPMGSFQDALDDMAFPNADTDPVSAISKASAQTARAGGVAGYQQYAKSKLAQFGWSESEMNALIELWDRESDWNPNADNPTSTAQGIAQKMQSVHGPVEPTPEGQIDWGLRYILDRYGSPSRALQHHNRNNWY